jgi:tetratricopeptide (TPR) repeat protein
MGNKRHRRRQSLGVLVISCSLPVAAQSTTPKEVQAIFAHGQKALADKQYPAAREDFSRLLRLGVRTAPVYSNLGVVYLHSGRPDEAIKMLESAERLAPTVAGIRLNLGLAYFREREFKLAAPYFGEVLSLDPNHVQARYLQGICAFMTDNFQAAVDSLQPLFAQESNDLEYLFMLGISDGMLKRSEESQQVFAQLVKAGGDTPHLHLLLGKAYLALGDLNAADEELTKADKDGPLPYAHYYRGIVAQKQGQMDRAADEFAQEVALIPNNPWAFRELAIIKVDRGDVRGATQLLERGVTNNPDTPDLYAALGRTYLQSANARSAVPALKRAISLDPRNGTYHFQLARAYLAEGLHQKADEEMAQTRALSNGGVAGQMELLSRGPADTATP